MRGFLRATLVGRTDPATLELDAHHAGRVLPERVAQRGRLGEVVVRADLVMRATPLLATGSLALGAVVVHALHVTIVLVLGQQFHGDVRLQGHRGSLHQLVRCESAGGAAAAAEPTEEILIVAAYRRCPDCRADRNDDD